MQSPQESRSPSPRRGAVRRWQVPLAGAATAIALLSIACTVVPELAGGLKRLMYETPGRDAWQQPDEVVEALDLEPGGRVADVGAGGGYFTFRLAEAVGATGRVYAVDVDSDLLAYVASQARKRGLPQVETLKASEAATGLPEACCDLIFLAHVFHHLPDPERYFRRAASALAPRGRVAIVESAADAESPSGHATAPERIAAAMSRAGFERTASHTFLAGQSYQVFALRPAAAQ